jgi:hypothetical protein
MYSATPVKERKTVIFEHRDFNDDTRLKCSMLQFYGIKINYLRTTPNFPSRQHKRKA